MTRPFLFVKPYVWKDKDGTPTAGLGLFGKRGIQAHLTPAEARRMADRLHDLTDAAGTAEEPHNKTYAESE